MRQGPTCAQKEEAAPQWALLAVFRGLPGAQRMSWLPSRSPEPIARAGPVPITKTVSGTIGLDGLNAAMDALAGGEALRTIVRPNA